MRTIVIISKVVVGARPVAFGMDRGINIFKKSLSENLKDKLNKRLLEESMDYKVSIDFTYDSCEELVKKGVHLLLISPYIKDKVQLDNISESKYYILSEKEFNEGQLENILIYICCKLK